MVVVVEVCVVDVDGWRFKIPGLVPERLRESCADGGVLDVECC